MKKNAFTLIELLVVITIVAILATLTASSFYSIFKKQHDDARGYAPPVQVQNPNDFYHR